VTTKANDTKTRDQIMAALAAPIPEDQIKYRVGSGGRQLAYITAQTAMERLDRELGPANWWNEMEMHERYAQCRLTLLFPDGSTLSRVGVGGYPDMPSEEDRVKGGATDAFKRTCVLMGIARNLYEDLTPDHAPQPARPPAQRQGSWGPPNGSGPRPQQQPQRQQQGGGQQYGPPRSGRGLFAWAKEHGCVKQVSDLAKAWGLEGRMVDWDEATVKQVYAAAVGESAEAGVGAGEEPADEYNF
jgi:hypothetical protein